MGVFMWACIDDVVVKLASRRMLSSSTSMLPHIQGCVYEPAAVSCIK